jgi:hypothetical protein
MKGLITRLGAGLTAFTLVAVLSTPTVFVTTELVAQEITSSITGTVVQSDGSAAAGVSATLTDTRDGRVSRTNTDDSGSLSFRSVGAGGPYTLRISGGGYEDLVITELYTSLAGTSSFTVTLEAASAAIEEIVVTASQINTIVTAQGPSSTFSLETIDNMPSSQRKIRDIIRMDPRIVIASTGKGEGGNGNGISCAGGSSRTNSFTIDGVRATDAFGLNLSGNLARFSFPVPFDAVAGAAVEFAPISVEYGNFSGCNINVVTKSGGNDFHAGGFYLFNDNDMTGDEINGDPYDQGTFERKNWGVDVSGPIIKDKLFFYAAYEEFETASVNIVGPADDASYPRNDTIFTTAELNNIRDILRNQYGRDVGEMVRNLPTMSERLLARVDWNISDRHRAELVYATVSEQTTIGDDIGTGRGEFAFSNNFYTRGTDSETYAARLFSDWTDAFSTEIRWSTQEVIDKQNPMGGGEQHDPVPIPRIAIGCCGQFGGEFFGQQFVDGPGTFRSANRLATWKDQLKAKFDYQMGDHLLTGGYELEVLDVFNLFIINATGTVFFDSIDSLAAGTAYEIRQGVSYTQDPTDAAAEYERSIHSLFLQDQWTVSDNLEVTFGVRYDWYASDDLPNLNPNYMTKYAGMTNEVGMDGLSAIQPRIGLSYKMPEETFGETRMTVGFGVFSGNDPTVWFSNAYQNFGGALGVGSAQAACDASALNVLAGGSFSGIPACVANAGANQALNNAGAVNATDPDLDVPVVNRYSFGLDHIVSSDNSFLDGWNVKFDMIYSDMIDQIDFLDLSLQQTGTAPDGRPTYAQVNALADGCNAIFNGPRMGYSGVTAECMGGNQDVFMTNLPGDGGYTFTTSIQAAKAFDLGEWDVNMVAGYSYNESHIGNPGVSFTAAENFRAVATDDIGLVPVGRSLRNKPHNLVLSAQFSRALFGDLTTSIGVFLNRQAGRDISAVFNGGPYAGAIGDTGGRARNLLYVPTDENDPLVTFADTFDTAGFFHWVDQEGLKRGAIQEKGGLSEHWQTDLDIRIQQEIPWFGDRNAMVYIDLENLTNLLSDSSGSKMYINTTDIAAAVGTVTADMDAATNTYVYQDFSKPTMWPDVWDSVWRLQVGIRADFF